MFQMILQTLILCHSAQAMIPPSGWVALGDGHAMRESGRPENGELIELSVDKDVVSLGFALMDAGLNVVDSNMQDNGDVVMTLDDGRIAYARYINAHWIVLSFGKEAGLRVDKIFSAVRFEKEATPWGEKAEEETGWKPRAAEEWKVDESLAGTWICSSMVKGMPIKIKIVLEAGGSVTWEEKQSGEMQIKKGQWLASSNRLSLEFENQTMFIEYERFQGALEVRYDSNNFKFLPR